VKRRARRPHAAPPRSAPERRRLSPRRLLPLAAALLAAAALVAQTGRTLDRIQASKRLRVVTVVSREMERAGKSPPQLVAGNLRLLREAARLDPTTVGIPVALAGQYMLLERYDSAIDLYRKALEIEARPEIYLNLGNALFASGRREEASEAYHKAVRLAPRLRRLVPAGAMRR
jgi:tetratricopeptide (TPR) repeat protein